jgi:hypothetical protein
MNPLSKAKAVLGFGALLASAVMLLAAARSASADQPFQRCPEDPSVVIPGPEICAFSYSVHNSLPAGTRCAFDVTIEYQVTGTIYFFENPPRAVAHSIAEGCNRQRSHADQDRPFHGNREPDHRLHRPRTTWALLPSGRRHGDRLRGLRPRLNPPAGARDIPRKLLRRPRRRGFLRGADIADRLGPLRSDSNGLQSTEGSATLRRAARGRRSAPGRDCPPLGGPSTASLRRLSVCSRASFASAQRSHRSTAAGSWWRARSTPPSETPSPSTASA